MILEQLSQALRGSLVLLVLGLGLGSPLAHARESARCEMVSAAPVRISAEARGLLDEDRTFRVKVYVDSLGRAQKVIVMNGFPGSAIDADVTRAALASTYRPAVRDGKMLPGCIVREFQFARLR
ncbi:hypothetical protein [Holophaga foetida]|uniref:hypothetical protein n=1 Tax=Holophaga foetida TaxID=35839 RepID=UPI0002473B6A|nr:hypothetical protein [Holophaga foetida]